MFAVLLIALTPFQADRVEILTEGNERIVHLLGNVVIEGSETRITCAEAKISETGGWVKLQKEVRLQDKNGEVNAGTAIYYFSEDRGFMSDSVTIVTADEKIFSDSLYYDGARDSVEMYGNVLIEDSKNDMTVAGGKGWYNLARDEGALSGEPRLDIARQDKTPITIYAETFKLYTDERIFHGCDSVRALIDSITVYCDTFAYDLKAERGTMVRPVIKEKNNELEGTHGQFMMKNKEIESVSVENGESTYYTKEGSKNVVEGDKIIIKFQEGKATMISVQGGPKGMLSLKKGGEDASD